MRVRVHPADRTGCGHYRLIWPTEALRAEGHDVHLVDLRDSAQVAETALGQADVFVFQRPTNQVLRQLIEDLRQRGKTVVVDMDDDLTCVHPKNPAWHLLHPTRSPGNNWEHARAACEAASLVTVSTVELQNRYGRFGRSRVLRNCIPKHFLAVQRPEWRPVWGWAGSLHSHPDDVPILGAAATRLKRQGFTFRIVGDPAGCGRALGQSQDPPGSGLVPFEDWASALPQLTVGAAPLADTRFNRGKSWLKPLEYAAVGIPWVATGLYEYEALHQLGMGFTVSGRRSEGWYWAVHELLTNETAWDEASQACRAVAAQLTIEEHAWRWLETWEVAYQMDRGYMRPGLVTTVKR